MSVWVWCDGRTDGGQAQPRWTATAAIRRLVSGLERVARPARPPALSLSLSLSLWPPDGGVHCTILAEVPLRLKAHAGVIFFGFLVHANLALQ